MPLPVTSITSPHHRRHTKGVYVFQEIPPGYWEELLSAKLKYHFALEWEVNETALRPPKQYDVRKIAERCDILSLNRSDSRGRGETCSLIPPGATVEYYICAFGFRSVKVRALPLRGFAMTYLALLSIGCTLAKVKRETSMAGST